MNSHLKSYQHYSDLYDRHTVDNCRRIEQSFTTDTKEILKEKKVTKGQDTAIKRMVTELRMYFETGERYLDKENTIRKWMDTDRKKDEMYESSQPPEDIRCLTCRNRLKATFKELWSDDRVLFMYDCPNKCLPRRSFFSDGEEWRTKPNLCPKCNIPLEHTTKDDGTKLVTVYSCSKCKHTETEEYLWTVRQEESLDENFAIDRDRFCLTEEDGKKYQEEKWNLEGMSKLMKEWKEEEKAREEKLAQNPKGFHLEGRGYTCAICGTGTPEGDNWYDQWGIKCLICQKAIDSKEIPPSLAKDKDSWYSKWEIESRFNVKSPTLRKWVKDGIIKARTVSLYGKGVHMEMYLIKDNKEFLPPKKLVESRSVTEKKDGKDWYTSQPWYKFVDPHKHLKGYKIMDYLKVIPMEDSTEK